MFRFHCLWIKFYGNTAIPICLWLFCIKTAVRSRIVTTELYLPQCLYTITVRPWIEKACQPLFWVILEKGIGWPFWESTNWMKAEKGWRKRNLETRKGRKGRQEPNGRCRVSWVLYICVANISTKRFPSPQEHLDSDSRWTCQGGRHWVFYTSFLVSMKDSVRFLKRNCILGRVRLGDCQSFLITPCASASTAGS